MTPQSYLGRFRTYITTYPQPSPQSVHRVIHNQIVAIPGLSCSSSIPTSGCTYIGPVVTTAFLPTNYLVTTLWDLGPKSAFARVVAT